VTPLVAIGTTKTELAEVLVPGAMTTLQDLGQRGGRRYGLPPGGALDAAAAKIANRLVQNPPDAAVLEITLTGPKLHFRQNALVSVTGAEFELKVGGRNVPHSMSLFVRANEILEFGRRLRGARAYLAVHGGFAAPVLLGSRATHLRAKTGGHTGTGRALAAGDVLEVYAGTLRNPAEGAGRGGFDLSLPAKDTITTVRIMPGAFGEYFSSRALEILTSEVYTVGAASDRMGLRLEGAPLPRREMGEITPHGVVWGTIQVPPDGQPIVLLADHQVTGGYPVIANVIRADLPLLAQLLPGTAITFSLA
jgi:antagonist of KipI